MRLERWKINKSRFWSIKYEKIGIVWLNRVSEWASDFFNCKMKWKVTTTRTIKAKAYIQKKCRTNVLLWGNDVRFRNLVDDGPVTRLSTSKWWNNFQMCYHSVRPEVAHHQIKRVANAQQHAKSVVHIKLWPFVVSGIRVVSHIFYQIFCKCNLDVIFIV